MNTNRLVIPVLIAGACAILVAFILGGAIRNIRNEDQNISVTGSAKKLIVSDLGIFRGSLTFEGQNITDAYNALEQQKPAVLAFLKSKGFKTDQIDYSPINTYANYSFDENGEQRGIRSYTVSQTIAVRSADVEAIRKLSVDAGSLLAQGVAFAVSPPEYYYTKIGEIKIQIQAEAAKDAMVRGQRIAEATGRKLGALTNARMGVLQITPENSNLTSDYGVNDVTSIRKEITAVISANFEID